MPGEERFDIYDGDGRWLGTALRSEAHAQGLWHRTFQCWIVSRDSDGVPMLLLQLRHPGKDTFPNLLDISCAGHLQAGESVEDGVRELEEELGLAVAFEQLWPCGVIAEEDVIGETLIDREFCHVFALACEQPLLAYTVQPDEVSGLFAVALDSFRRLLAGETARVEVQGFVVDEQDRKINQTRWISPDELVPHPAAYYDLLFAGINAMLAAWEA